MGLRVFVLCALLLAGCASVGGSFQTLAQLQLLQRLETLPEDWNVPGESHAKYLQTLTTWATKRQIQVVDTKFDDTTLAGRTVWKQSGTVVYLEQRLSANARLATLVHELAHVLHGTYLNKQAGEVYAELVAVQVCGALGLDISKQSAAYLRPRVEMSLQWSVAQTFGPQIDRIVPVLVKAARGEHVD